MKIEYRPYKGDLPLVVIPIGVMILLLVLCRNSIFNDLSYCLLFVAIELGLFFQIIALYKDSYKGLIFTTEELFVVSQKGVCISFKWEHFTHLYCELYRAYDYRILSPCKLSQEAVKRIVRKSWLTSSLYVDGVVVFSLSKWGSSAKLVPVIDELLFRTML